MCILHICVMLGIKGTGFISYADPWENTGIIWSMAVSPGRTEEVD